MHSLFDIMNKSAAIFLTLTGLTLLAWTNKVTADHETAHETLRLCPRNLDNVDTGYRKCLRPCLQDQDCKGRKKKCLCDGDCGMSCVKPNTKCAPLIDPANGKVHTTGIEAFGAKVFYTCQPEFKLRGPRARSCQGDGTWSGDAPICQPDVKCDDPPEIAHGQHNADWRNRQYELDTMIQYTCESGYSIEGFARAKCIYFNGSAKWFGPDLRCVPRECGHPGDILNGFREGDLLYYPHRVKFHCYPGFNLVGKPIRYCQRNGKWDGENPICKAVECHRPQDPYNGKAIITSLKYESVVTYECKSGYHLARTDERRCLANQTWSGPEPKCEVVNCPQPDPVPNGGYNGTSTSYNSVIFFYCNKGMKFVGTYTSAKCLANATWSHSPPKCYAPCAVPFIEHGKINGSPGDFVSHGDLLNASCVPKYEQAYSTILPKCHNGSFLYVPTCQPASCKSPPVNPRRGLVIAPKTDHGMKARFVCNKGYKIVGNDTVACEYGNWTGDTPFCQEIYCPWPGKLGNGTIYLVGAMGSYEYYDYIKTVVQDRQIRYECYKGYFLHGGPSGATCVDGNWSPVEKPKCYPAPCSELKSSNFEQSNLLRDPEDASHYIATIKCRAGFATNTPNGRANCRNGVWTPRKPDCVPFDLLSNIAIVRREPKIGSVTCRVPESMNGHFKHDNGTIAGWTQLEDSAFIDLVCIPGYQINGPPRLRCSTGQFFPPTVPECIPASCSLVDIQHGSYSGGYRSGLQVSHNSLIAYHCDDEYRKLPNSAVRCDLGKLMPKEPECVPIGTPADAHDVFTGKQSCSRPRFEYLEDLNHTNYVHGTTVDLPCEGNFTKLPLRYRTLVCLNGKWIRHRNTSCNDNDNFSAVTDNNCEVKETSPNLRACHGDFCLDLSDAASEKAVFVENAELQFHCEHIGRFQLSGPRRLTCLGGKWNGDIPKCEDLMFSFNSLQHLNLPPAILYQKTSGIIGISSAGELLVYPSTNLQLDCLWKRIDGAPSWTASHQFRVYPKGWVSGENDNRDHKFRLSIYHAVEEDSGIFTCVTPRGKAHSIVVKVKTVECPIISVPESKILANTSSTRMGTVVAFNCSRGYRLSGPNLLRCESSGLWSDFAPNCLPITCPMINITDSKMKVHGSSRELDSFVEFSCLDGSKLVGPAIAKCGEDSEWSNDLPVCEEQYCPSPATPENRVIVPDQKFTFGDEIEIDCPPGFAVNGSSNIICLDSGRWSDELVSCVPSCNYPGHPLNGRIAISGILKFHYEVGEEISFACDEGFSIQGVSKLTCLDDGRWSSQLPACFVR